MKRLIFAEKPSVGREIARILNAGQRGDGYFEGPDDIVTWGVGHLITIAEPGIQNPQWKAWSISNLPMIPQNWLLVVIPQSQKQFETVKQLMNRKDIKIVINAADAGREGELIFRYVYMHAECKKPVQRLWISSMTDEAIKEGLTKLRESTEFDNLGAAAESRSRADWLIGMNFTRAYTKKFNVMLTVGRVQTPTLGLIVSRQAEIDNFKPSDYWEIQLDFGDFKALWNNPDDKENPTKISEHAKALEIFNRISGKPCIVSSLSRTKKKQPPPMLYDLTTLQREANSKFGFSAAKTLQIAQTLYESKKVITYPRTDSRYLTDDVHPTLNSRFKALPQAYSSFLEPILGKPLSKTKRIFDKSKVQDHHAIIPTEQKVKSSTIFSDDENKVYDLIVRRFISVFYPDMEYMATVLLLDCENEQFKATGRIITKAGWKAVYSNTVLTPDEDDDEKVSTIPDLKKGEAITPEKSEILTKQTRPPAYYTEASLLQAMETAGRLIKDEELRQAMKDSGLGTPATRAEIIEKLIRVEYIIREKKKLLATEKGKKLINLIDPKLKSPNLTGDWEKRLAMISRGQDNSESFMKDIASYTQELVRTIKASSFSQVVFDKPSSENKYSSPAKKNVPEEAASKNEKNRSSEKPETSVKENSTKQTSKKSTQKSASAETITREPLGKCPLCGKGEIIEGKGAFGCNRFLEGCKFILISKLFKGKKITKTMVKQILTGKPSRIIKGFSDEKGQSFDGKIVLVKTNIEIV
ncbi:MAG: DNA topoisomerase III [Candidatus Riflebacteria bacterium]|nr:DNA topoisomerase III [Candidatus Riflebacteria bacterium]